MKHKMVAMNNLPRGGSIEGTELSAKDWENLSKHRNVVTIKIASGKESVPSDPTYRMWEKVPEGAILMSYPNKGDAPEFPRGFFGSKNNSQASNLDKFNEMYVKIPGENDHYIERAVVEEYSQGKKAGNEVLVEPTLESIYGVLNTLAKPLSGVTVGKFNKAKGTVEVTFRNPHTNEVFSGNPHVVEALDAIKKASELLRAVTGDKGIHEKTKDRYNNVNAAYEKLKNVLTPKNAIGGSSRKMDLSSPDYWSYYQRYSDKVPMPEPTGPGYGSSKNNDDLQKIADEYNSEQRHGEVWYVKDGKVTNETEEKIAWEKAINSLSRGD